MASHLQTYIFTQVQWAKRDPRQFIMSFKAAVAYTGGNDIVLAKSFIIAAEGTPWPGTPCSGPRQYIHGRTFSFIQPSGRLGTQTQILMQSKHPYHGLRFLLKSWKINVIFPIIHGDPSKAYCFSVSPPTCQNLLQIGYIPSPL